MKFYFFLLTLASCGVCMAHQDAPRHIRMYFQWIEMSHPLLTEMMSGEKKSGTALHAAAFAYVKEGKAKIVNTDIVVCKSGQRSNIESIREEIFPTEYSPPGSVGEPYPPVVPDIRSITSFETRNTGVMIEVEPTLGNDDSIIDLRLNAEIVAPGRLVTWMEHKDQWGDASVRMPFYETWRVQTSLSIANGKFELAHVISPKPTQPTPFVQTKILLFVRADVVSVSR